MLKWKEVAGSSPEGSRLPLFGIILLEAKKILSMATIDLTFRASGCDKKDFFGKLHEHHAFANFARLRSHYSLVRNLQLLVFSVTTKISFLSSSAQKLFSSHVLRICVPVYPCLLRTRPQATCCDLI